MLSSETKILLISVAVIFMAMGLKVSLPLATTHLPQLWTFFLLCFKPPYLYVIVNVIIISIVASSRFHHSSDSKRYQPRHPIRVQPVHAYEIVDSDPKLTVTTVPEPPVLDVKAVVVNGSVAIEEEEEEKKEIEVDVPPPQRMDSMEIPPEYLLPEDKPLVSVGFGHRKPPKSSPEGGRAWRVVANAKRHETLENTWKAITEGQSMPLSRHTKKCDTWQNRGGVDPPTSVNIKSETFNDGSNNISAPVKLRKEPSLSQDELNRQAEAFIRKVNEEMRLQRQQSLKQYMEMINRGTS